MPAPLSLDLRQRFVDAYEDGEGTIAELAARFSIGEATGVRLLALFRRTGSVAPRDRGGPRNVKLTAEHDALLMSWFVEQPDITIADAQRRLKDEVGVSVHLSTVHRRIINLGLTWKKKRSPMPSGALSE